MLSILQVGELIWPIQQTIYAEVSNALRLSKLLIIGLKFMMRSLLMKLIISLIIKTMQNIKFRPIKHVQIETPVYANQHL